MKQQVCNYYQAYLKRSEVVTIISILKSFDHICFDRCVDVKTSLFEFFVPGGQEALFLSLMDYFKELHLVTALKHLPNRLLYEPLVS